MHEKTCEEKNRKSSAFQRRKCLSISKTPLGKTYETQNHACFAFVHQYRLRLFSSHHVRKHKKRSQHFCPFHKTVHVFYSAKHFLFPTEESLFLEKRTFQRISGLSNPSAKHLLLFVQKHVLFQDFPHAFQNMQATETTRNTLVFSTSGVYS